MCENNSDELFSKCEVEFWEVFLRKVRVTFASWRHSCPRSDSHCQIVDLEDIDIFELLMYCRATLRYLIRYPAHPGVEYANMHQLVPLLVHGLSERNQGGVARSSPDLAFGRDPLRFCRGEI